MPVGNEGTTCQESFIWLSTCVPGPRIYFGVYLTPKLVTCSGWNDLAKTQHVLVGKAGDLTDIVVKYVTYISKRCMLKNDG